VDKGEIALKSEISIDARRRCPHTSDARRIVGSTRSDCRAAAFETLAAWHGAETQFQRNTWEYFAGSGAVSQQEMGDASKPLFSASALRSSKKMNRHRSGAKALRPVPVLGE